MKDLPYFLKLVGANKLICDVLTSSKINEGELVNQAFIRSAPGRVTLKDFHLNEIEKFRDVNIWISPFGTLIDFFTDDLKYFDNALHYFDCETLAKKKRPVIADGIEYQVKGRKTAKFLMLSKDVHGTIFRSEHFGCMISLGFFYAGDNKRLLKAPLVHQDNSPIDVSFKPTIASSN